MVFVEKCIKLINHDYEGMRRSNSNTHPAGLSLSHLLPESGVANLAGERFLLPVNGGDVLLHEALGGGRVAALVAVEGPVLEVHGVHVDVEVDLLPEPPLAHLAGERPLFLVHQVDVLVETRLARALVLANRASGRNR